MRILLFCVFFAISIQANIDCLVKEWNLFCLVTFPAEMDNCIEGFNFNPGCYEGYCADLLKCERYVTKKNTIADHVTIKPIQIYQTLIASTETITKKTLQDASSKLENTLTPTKQTTLINNAKSITPTTVKGQSNTKINEKKLLNKSTIVTSKHNHLTTSKTIDTSFKTTLQQSYTTPRYNQSNLTRSIRTTRASLKPLTLSTKTSFQSTPAKKFTLTTPAYIKSGKITSVPLKTIIPNSTRTTQASLKLIALSTKATYQSTTTKKPTLTMPTKFGKITSVPSQTLITTSIKTTPTLKPIALFTKVTYRSTPTKKPTSTTPISYYRPVSLPVTTKPNFGKLTPTPLSTRQIWTTQSTLKPIALSTRATFKSTTKKTTLTTRTSFTNLLGLFPNRETNFSKITTVPLQSILTRSTTDTPLIPTQPILTRQTTLLLFNNGSNITTIKKIDKTTFTTVLSSLSTINLATTSPPITKTSSLINTLPLTVTLAHTLPTLTQTSLTLTKTTIPMTTLTTSTTKIPTNSNIQLNVLPINNSLNRQIIEETKKSVIRVTLPDLNKEDTTTIHAQEKPITENYNLSDKSEFIQNPMPSQIVFQICSIILGPLFTISVFIIGLFVLLKKLNNLPVRDTDTSEERSISDLKKEFANSFRKNETRPTELIEMTTFKKPSALMSSNDFEEIDLVSVEEITEKTQPKTQTTLWTRAKTSIKHYKPSIKNRSVAFDTNLKRLESPIELTNFKFDDKEYEPFLTQPTNSDDTNSITVAEIHTSVENVLPTNPSKLISLNPGN